MLGVVGFEGLGVVGSCVGGLVNVGVCEGVGIPGLVGSSSIMISSCFVLVGVFVCKLFSGIVSGMLGVGVDGGK